MMRQAMPLDAREAYYIVESGAVLSLTELENLPQLLTEKVLNYRMVKSAIENGLEVLL